MQERICPIDGSVCPFQKVLEQSYNSSPRQIQKVVAGTGALLKYAARQGECHGAFTAELRHGSVVHCDNSNLPHMESVYEMSRSELELDDFLPERAAQVGVNI